MDEPTATQFKSYANHIVGMWYNEVSNEILEFSFIDDFDQQSDLLILDKDLRINATYNILNTNDGDWLLVVWEESDIKVKLYHIEFLNSDILILTSRKLELKVYLRNIDIGFVRNVLNRV